MIRVESRRLGYASVIQLGPMTIGTGMHIVLGGQSVVVEAFKSQHF